MKKMINPSRTPLAFVAQMWSFTGWLVFACLGAGPAAMAQGQVSFLHPIGGDVRNEAVNPLGPPRPPSEATITRIVAEGDEIAITVWIPAGKQRVTLECRPRLGPGSWVPESRKNLEGRAAVVEFRLANRRALELLRVRAESANDLPLPAAFYTGKSQFQGVIVTNGSGTVSAVGGLPPATPGATVVAMDGNGQSLSLKAFQATVSDPGARTVAESDIWRWDGNTLYFFNQGRGLQVIDVTDPDHPQLRGTLPVAAYGEQMYLLPAVGPAGERYVALLLASSCSDGGSVLVAQVGAAGVTTVNQLPFTGQLRESRLVGNVLYLASYWWHTVPSTDPGNPTNGGITVTQWQSDTAITSYNLVNPATAGLAPATLSLTANPVAISATDQFLFIATAGTPAYDPALGVSLPAVNTVEIIDISDPAGGLVRRGSVATRGSVADKFKLSQEGDVLRVVSFANSNGQALYTTNWFSRADGKLVVVTGGLPGTAKNPPPAQPELYRTEVSVQWVWPPTQTWLETYSLTDASAPAKLGELLLRENEQLFATRFAGNRAYVVTFRRTDPLFLVDLADPIHPSIRGRLEVPGFSTYLSPLGDTRLLAMGLENGQPMVSLFDVADLTQPRLLSKVDLKSQNGWGYSEANSDEKAFNYSPEAGLILFPWQGWRDGNSFQTIQLVDLKDDVLTRRGVIDHPVTARRATVVGERVVSISAAALLTVSITDRDHPALTAQLELQYRVDRTWILGDRLLQLTYELAPNGQIGRPSIRVAPQSAPEQPTGLLSLPADLVTLGLDLRGSHLHVLQQAPTTYRNEAQVSTNTVQEWVTHKQSRIETNVSVTVLPSEFRTTFTTNLEVVTQAQPPIKPILATNLWVVEIQYPLFPTLVPYQTNINCPPDLTAPCTTNVFSNLVWVELPPLIRTNRTYVYGPEIPQPDLVVTNEIVIRHMDEIPGQIITNAITVVTNWYALPPVLETNQYVVTNLISVPVPGYLLASVLECSGAAPVLLGQSRSESAVLFNSSALAAVWPGENLLVWTDARDTASYYPGPYLTLGPQFGGFINLGVLQPAAVLGDWRWWGGGWGGQSQAHFIPVEVTDSTQPLLKAPITTGDAQSWSGLHSAYAADGRIYLSHETHTQLPTEAATNNPATKPGAVNGIFFNGPVIGMPFWTQRWETRYHLDVLDLTDPEEARLRAPLALPGPLCGISHAGALLYARGGVDANGTWTDRLQALSYDGLEVNLVDTLPLSSSSLVLRDGGIALIGTSKNPATLESWSLGTDARWHKYAEVALAGQAALGLHAYPDGLVIAERDGGTFSFLRSAGSDGLILLGDAPGQCGLSPDWPDSDASLTAGLWLARGPFGLWGVRPTAVPVNP